MRVFPHKYGESVLLAVSGGADSLVMGELFLRDNGVEGPSVRLAVAHCNFHLRGAESDADAAFVQKWASERGLKCHIVDFDTLAFASERGVSVEMAARELRYRWFDELCSEYGYSGVCVAHNANDNAETLVLNLLRGTGLRGLCAMGETSLNPYGSSKVFRPVLAYSRAEIEAFATEHKLAFRTDSTNACSDYKRNRIRNEVFPVFEKINPSFIDTFAENISHLKDASAIVSEYVGGFGFDEGGRLSIKALKSFRHWEYVLYSVLSGYGFSSAVITDLTALLNSDRIVSGKRFDSAGYLLVTTTSELILQPKDSGAAALFFDDPSHRSAAGPSPCGQGGSTVSEETCRSASSFGVELIEWKPGMSPKTERGEILVDADKLDGEPRFRRWQAGDWLNPIGLKGRKKVSDMLTDLKYNILDKENVYVLEGSGHHVLAVVGERIDASVRITPDTTRVWKITSLIA